LPVTTAIAAFHAVDAQPELTQQSQPAEQFELTEQPKLAQPAQ
jgi:hypothetical protein